MSQVKDTIEYLLNTLDPFRQVGIIVRTVSDTPSAIGRVNGNGVLVLGFVGDSKFESENTLYSVSQRFMSEYMIMGRLENLRDADGIYGVRDALYELTVGVRPGTGYPIRAKKMSVTRGESSQWELEYRFEVPCVLVGCAGETGLGEEPYIDGVTSTLKNLFVTGDAELTAPTAPPRY